MKKLKKILLSFLIIIALAILGLIVTGNAHILNGITKTWLIGKSKPDIDDMKYFDLREIKNGEFQPWEKAADYNSKKLSQQLLDDIKTYGTTAFLVIHNDQIISEHYWENYTQETYSNSFSMAKSFMATCIGIAIDEGEIKGVDQKVGDFLPWFKHGELNQKLTVKDLLTMSSGIDYGESYSNPFGFQAKAYYGHDLKSLVKKYDVNIEPGILWKYEGGNSILLGMILEKATGKTVSDYFSEKIWSKIGASKPAFWNLDDEGGMEKTFSAVYSNARDFARMGKLYLNNGKWNNQKIVSQEYVAESLTPVNIKNTEGENVDYYGYHYWLGKYQGKSFFGPRGMRGQYIIVIPQDNLIVVRLGHDRPKTRKDHLTTDTFDYIREAYRLIQ